MDNDELLGGMENGSISMAMINKDAWHIRWLDNYETFAWSRSSKQHSMGMIIAPTEEMGVYECEGQIELPSGSGAMSMEMARFSTTTLPMAHDLIGTAVSLPLPDLTFSLHALIWASYPRDPLTGVFNNTLGGRQVFGPMDGEDVEDDADIHRAFAGMGVILLRRTRMILNPIISDMEVTNMCADRYVAIYD